MSEGIERSVGFTKATKLWLRAGLDYLDSKALYVEEIKTTPEALSQGGLFCKFDDNIVEVVLDANNEWKLYIHNTFTGQVTRDTGYKDEDIIEVFRNGKANLDITKAALLKLLGNEFGTDEFKSSV
jgi:hypothetical protein